MAAGSIVVTRDDLRSTIAAGLATMRPYQRRSLGIDPDATREWLVEDLVRRIAERDANSQDRSHG